MRGEIIGISTGCLDEISNRLNAIEPERIRRGNWVAIKRKEAVDLLESFNTHKLANIVNPLIVISNYQRVQVKMNIYT
jgi:hypothetical protein